MRTFIEEVASSLGPEENWVNTTVVFPNRRAGLFFRQVLADMTKGKAVFAPDIFSFEDFVFEQVPYQPADALILTGLLYKSYKKVYPKPDSFADFFFWGKMILRDFDDIDQHLADAKAVYSVVEQQKQLEIGLGFLSPEQIKILSTFWKKFTEDPTKHKEYFVSVWKRLFPLYEDFNSLLQKEGLAYKGLAYKLLANRPTKYVNDDNQRYIFAGFNALTKAEEEIITFFLTKTESTIIWDADNYYMKDRSQEAGRFMRTLSRKSTFTGTFQKEIPDNIRNRKEPVDIIGVPFRAGQAKYVGQELEKIIKENPDLPLHKIAIVLPDEQLLFSVLNAIPPSVDKFNVTMGFPVETTPLFSLMLHCIDLQEHIKTEKETIYFRPVVKILQHPLIQQIAGRATEKFLTDLLRQNTVQIELEELLSLHPLFEVIFKNCGNEYTAYLLQILEQLSSYEEELTSDNLTALNFITNQLAELQEFEKDLKLDHDRRNFARFLRQLLSSDKIPFEGEPLQGLQIMGVLETRNLDFEYIFVLSLNEDFFPADSRQKSFVPYNIRKAFSLPVFDQQDAIYAYLFYRLFQRSNKVTLLYNTEGNVFGGQEMSRFLQQLIIEKPFPVKHKLLNTPVKPKPAEKIVIEKDEEILSRLNNYVFSEGNPRKWIYPSTMYSYLHCRLQFYFKYIAGIREADEIEDEIDARLFGNILHDTMELLYKNLIERKGSRMVEERDFPMLKKEVPVLIEAGFKKQFNAPPDKKFDFTGQNIIQRDILTKFIMKILERDKELTPFKILALETDNEDGYEIPFTIHKDGEQKQIGLKGKIDRLDEVNGNIRVIDYKTGKDESKFAEVADLFERDTKKPNKAAFQTLFYSLLYNRKHPGDQPLTPGLYSRNRLFEQPFNYRLETKAGQSKYAPLEDYNVVKEDYEELMQELLQELFDENTPFDQTEETSRCSYCSYNGICQR